jgi:hypothetical protein
MYSDEEIIKVIRLLMEGEGDEEQLSYWQEHELFGLEDVFNLIFHTEKILTAEEILQRARDMSKPILL